MWYKSCSKESRDFFGFEMNKYILDLKINLKSESENRRQYSHDGLISGLDCDT